MIGPARSAPLARFSNPNEALSHLDAENAGALIASAADVALVMDRDGVILDVAFSEADLVNEIGGDWIGRLWVTTVSPDSRQKIEDMLNVATPTALARWRQVNHPTGHGADIPVRYRIGRFGPNGRLLAVGRDLRPLAVLQQRLAEAQQEMEREYVRIRNAEKRYRLLFQLASEAVLILDSNTSRILEANPAAVTFLGIEPKKLIGQSFESLFTESSRQVSQSFLSATRVAPRVDNVHVQLERDQKSVLLTGSLYRQDGAPHLFVLLSRLGGETGGATSTDDVNILRLVEAIPEAFRGRRWGSASRDRKRRLSRPCSSHQPGSGAGVRLSNAGSDARAPRSTSCSLTSARTEPSATFRLSPEANSAPWKT